MPKVLIVDDHAIVRSGLRRFLDEEAKGYDVREAGNGPQGLELCRAERWDVVLLDLSLPGIGGQAVLQQLRQNYPDLPVLMLSFALEAEQIRQCLDAGAAGYVVKEEIPDHILPAIRAVLAGNRYLSPEVKVVIAPNPGNPPFAG